MNDAVYPDPDAQRSSRRFPRGIAVMAFAAGALCGWWLRPGSVPAAAVVAVTPSSAAVVSTTKPAVPAVLAADHSPVVAKVGDGVVTLREVEDSLLKKEGVEQVVDMLNRQFQVTDWKGLEDQQVVVSTATWRLTRAMLAAQLLREGAATAREDLINIRLVEQALAKANVVIDQAAVDAEVHRTEKRLNESLDARKQPHIDFRSFIQQQEKMTLEDYVRQPAFRMGAGIHILVQRRAQAEITEDHLKQYFVENIERYRVQEAADISDIYIPYQTQKDAAGKEVVTVAERERLKGVMAQLHGAIFQRKVGFDRTFATFNGGVEQNADAAGRLGWVNRDGTRPVKGTRVVARRAIDAAFAAQPPYPVLLEPVASDAGIDLILIHSRRPGKEPGLAETKERLLIDLVDSEIKPRTKRLLDDLRRETAIDYLSLPELVERRAAEAGLNSKGVAQP